MENTSSPNSESQNASLHAEIHEDKQEISHHETPTSVKKLQSGFQPSILYQPVSPATIAPEINQADAQKEQPYISTPSIEIADENQMNQAPTSLPTSSPQPSPHIESPTAISGCRIENAANSTLNMNTDNSSASINPERPRGHSSHVGISGSGGHVSSVLLYGIHIVSLWIDGQERLCLAQISNTLLKQFSYNEIHNRRVALGITCVQCTPVQLEILRRAGAMPVSSRRCGMITLREAHRLVKSFLEETAPPKLSSDFRFDVKHDCGWGCRGQFYPARYNSSRAKCVQCNYCSLFFSPNKFIFHFHRVPQSAYKHPDAANFNSWRRHLVLAHSPEMADNESLTHAWEDVKAMFNGGSRRRVLAAAVARPRISSSSAHAPIIGRRHHRDERDETGRSAGHNVVEHAMTMNSEEMSCRDTHVFGGNSVIPSRSSKPRATISGMVKPPGGSSVQLPPVYGGDYPSFAHHHYYAELANAAAAAKDNINSNMLPGCGEFNVAKSNLSGVGDFIGVKSQNHRDMTDNASFGETLYPSYEMLWARHLGLTETAQTLHKCFSPFVLTVHSKRNNNRDSEGIELLASDKRQERKNGANIFRPYALGCNEEGADDEMRQ